MVKEYLFCSKRLETNNKACNFRCFECPYFRRMTATQIRKKFNVVPEDLVIDNVMFGVTFVDETVVECSCSNDDLSKLQHDHETKGA